MCTVYVYTYNYTHIYIYTYNISIWLCVYIYICNVISLISLCIYGTPFCKLWRPSQSLAPKFALRISSRFGRRWRTIPWKPPGQLGRTWGGLTAPYGGIFPTRLVSKWLHPQSWKAKDAHQKRGGPSAIFLLLGFGSLCRETDGWTYYNFWTDHYQLLPKCRMAHMYGRLYTTTYQIAND
jgi:hypothetical protein